MSWLLAGGGERGRCDYDNDYDNDNDHAQDLASTDPHGGDPIVRPGGTPRGRPFVPLPRRC
jgi:hypothetical protein